MMEQMSGSRWSEWAGHLQYARSFAYALRSHAAIGGHLQELFRVYEQIVLNSSFSELM